MNTNAIRVHGHVAGRALYDVADEMGMMIWQDVPLQWGYDSSDAFTKNCGSTDAGDDRTVWQLTRHHRLGRP